MIISKKDEKRINKYFRGFVIQNKNAIWENGYSDIIKEIENKKEVFFNSDWNYLMALILTIENVFNIEEIISHYNYVRFKFENITIQDKGSSKLEAYYIVCFKTLKEFWKDGDTVVSYENHEPFDEIDLK